MTHPRPCCYRKIFHAGMLGSSGFTVTDQPTVQMMNLLTTDVMESLRNKSIPVLTCITADVNSRSLTTLSLFSLF